MNMNLSVSALGHPSHFPAFSEGGPGCGMHPSGLPSSPPPQPQMLSFDVSNRLDHVALNPQPLPPREAKNGDDNPLCPEPPPRPWLDSFGQASLQVLNALGLSGSQTAGQERGIIIVGG